MQLKLYNCCRLPQKNKSNDSVKHLRHYIKIFIFIVLTEFYGTLAVIKKNATTFALFPASSTHFKEKRQCNYS